MIDIVLLHTIFKSIEAYFPENVFQLYNFVCFEVHLATFLS